MPRLVKVFLLAVLALSLVAGAYGGARRWVLESGNRQVEVLLEYSEVVRLARYSRLPEGEVMARLKAAGATSILFKEQTLGELQPLHVWTASAAQLLGSPETAGLRSELAGSGGIFILTRDAVLFNRLQENLELKVPGSRFLTTGSGLYLADVPRTRNELDYIGLGFPETAIDQAREHGLGAAVQLRSFPQAAPGAVSQLIGWLGRYRNLTSVYFNDSTLPAFPAALPETVAALRQLGRPVGIIEFFSQQGLSQVVVALDKKAVRLHSISAGEMSLLSPGRAVDRFLLAVKERDIRTILVRFKFSPTERNWLSAGESYLSSLVRALQAEGFTGGAATPFDSLPLPGWYYGLVGLGVLAAGVLLLDSWGLGRQGLALGLLGLVLGGLAFYAGHGLLARQVLALGAAVIFPTWAVTRSLTSFGSTPGKSVRLFLWTSLHSLAAVPLIIGLLAGVSFMLRVDQFLGVKAAYILPPVLVMGCLFWRAEGKHSLDLLLRAARQPLTVLLVAVAAVLAAAAYMYLMRTGNEGAPVSSLELALRQALDQILVVRPRTKEFLIGHPFLLLSFFLGYSHRYLPIVFFGIVGQISLVNTFAHVHTPLAVSLLRAFNGLWVGIVLGVILIFVWRWLVRWGRRYIHADAGEEQST